MATLIRLLGPPVIEIDGRAAPGPRGRKSWGLLAFLLLVDRPASRQRLSGLLFEGAGDPLGALRWSLAELRRALGDSAEVGGDPVVIALSPGTAVDFWRVTESSPELGGEPPGELLEGLCFPGCPGFESWLLVERRRWAARVEAVLHERGLARLAVGRPHEAARIGAHLVQLNPYLEANHTLLVRALAVTGNRRAAAEAAAAAGTFFRRELGCDPSPALADALNSSVGRASVPASRGVAAAQAQLEAGRAAIAAGAIEAGIDCLRRSVDELRYAEDGRLLPAALCELGGALVHAVRGRDEEGAAVLHEALERAGRCDAQSAARACRELGFVDVQAGRRVRAAVWLSEARTYAERLGDDAELAAIAGVEGMNLSDQARYPEALAVLTDSVQRALAGGAGRQAAWSASLVGRLHFLRGDLEQAARSLIRSVELVERERWLAFRPWPQAFLAEIDLVEGRRDEAEQRLTEAFALSCQLGDPCWEGVTARGLGLLNAAKRPEWALATLLDARSRCTRWPDTYQWISGYILDATCTVAAPIKPAVAAASATELVQLAAHADMPELVCRGHLHLAAMGVSGAAEAAAIAAAEISNPVMLHAMTLPTGTI